MDFVRRQITNYETVITAEMLDSFQDGIIEAITKAESALATKPSVHNAPTLADFPSVGSSNVIYKAELEALLYQWNSNEGVYEPLNDSCNCITDDSVLDGGAAGGFDGSDVDVTIIDGGNSSGL